MTRPSAPAPQQLGRSTPLPPNPDAAMLEKITNPHPDQNYLIRLSVPEFTCLCPITKQPDFAHIIVDYVPQAYIVESKSFKLYMGSFRNHGAFHEDCTLKIGKRLLAELAPKWLRLGGFWYPRGGIPIDVHWQSAPPPDDIIIPAHNIQTYRGR